jgi:Skp family chaperone for outer membrane proteins
MAQAQTQTPDWFMPGQATGQAPSRPAPRAPPPPAPAAAATAPAPAAAVAQPPIPQLPPLQRGPTPPAAVIGVLGVRQVMHDSTAAQEIEKVIGQRRDKLTQDAQKEQAAWRDMQQSLANDRAKLSADQIRARERTLQDRITNAQRQFRDRGKIIQDAAQFALGQIERTLIAVIREVADSRTMNLVLHRSQVALNVNEFDITLQVTEQLNRVLPAVTIPPDGQEPSVASASAPPAAADATATAATAPSKKKKPKPQP